MRTEPIEKLLRMICDEVDHAVNPVPNRLRNYCTKARIVMDRSSGNDNRAASVIREVMNYESAERCSPSED